MIQINGPYLRQKLKEKGLTQEELSFLLDVRTASISELFNDRRSSVNKSLLTSVMDQLEIEDFNKVFLRR